MMREAEQITVSVAGDTYTLVSDEGVMLLEEASRDVDALMKQVASRSRSNDMRRAAVFTAIKLAHELKRMQQINATGQQRALELVKTITDELRKS